MLLLVKNKMDRQKTEINAWIRSSASIIEKRLISNPIIMFINSEATLNPYIIFFIENTHDLGKSSQKKIYKDKTLDLNAFFHTGSR